MSRPAKCQWQKEKGGGLYARPAGPQLSAVRLELVTMPSSFRLLLFGLLGDDGFRGQEHRRDGSSVL